jgi:hypothetical protein
MPVVTVKTEHAGGSTGRRVCREWSGEEARPSPTRSAMRLLARRVWILGSWAALRTRALDPPASN